MTGIVSDLSGTVVPSCEVSITHLATGVVTSTAGFTIAGGRGSWWEIAMDGMPASRGSTAYQTGRAPLS